MCNKSESIQKLAVALVKFNLEVKIIEKDASNPHFKNRYASLDTIIDEVRPLLAKHGLSVLQFPGGDGEKFTLRSMLVHESGEWIESEPLTMRPVKNDPQGIGSCNTYARRYSLSSLLSLNTGEDDDGNNASLGNGQQTQQQAHTGAQNHRNTESRSNGAAATSGQSTVSNGLNAKSRVMNLKTELKWDWDSLASFAADVLKRNIGKVISDVKTEEEWKKIEEQMLVTKAAAS
jgi:hypothetical protein